MPAICEPLMRCLTCDYDLRGLDKNRCPECGRRFNPDDSRTYGPRPARPISFVLLPVLGCCMILICYFVGVFLAGLFFPPSPSRTYLWPVAVTVFMGGLLLRKGFYTSEMLLSLVIPEVLIAIDLLARHGDLWRWPTWGEILLDWVRYNGLVGLPFLLAAAVGTVIGKPRPPV